MEVFHRGRLRIVNNGLDMGGEGGDSRGGDMMAEEINGRLGKRAFGEVDQEAISG